MTTDFLDGNQLKVLGEGHTLSLQIVEGVPLWMNMPDFVTLSVEVCLHFTFSVLALVTIIDIYFLATFLANSTILWRYVAGQIKQWI